MGDHGPLRLHDVVGGSVGLGDCVEGTEVIVMKDVGLPGAVKISVVTLIMVVDSPGAVQVSVFVRVMVVVTPGPGTVTVGETHGRRLGSRGVGWGCCHSGGSPIFDTSDAAVTSSADATSARLQRNLISD